MLKCDTLMIAEGKWTVAITTSEMPSSGTGAQVLITVYGDRGHTASIPLGIPGGEFFQTGKVDAFEVCHCMHCNCDVHILHA